MSDDKTEDQVRRGHQAHALLDSTAFQDATTELRAEMLELWERCTDRDERDRIWHSLNLLEQLKHKLAMTAAYGRDAQRKIDEQEQR